MLALKIATTFLLLWFAAGVVGLIFNSRMPRGTAYWLDRWLRGYTCLPHVAGVIDEMAEQSAPSSRRKSRSFPPSPPAALSFCA
jgi:hypothetical protein